MSPSTHLLQAGLLDPPVVQDPYAYYSMLRTHAPVHYHERHRAWLVSRYEEVRVGLRDDENFSVDRVAPMIERHFPDDPSGRKAFGIMQQFAAFQDPPVHTRLRSTFHKSFTPRQVEQRRVSMAELAAGLVDGYLSRLADAGCDGLDLVDELASAYGAIAIASTLGVPPRDRDEFCDWTEAVGTIIDGNVSDEGRFGRAAAAIDNLVAYLNALIARAGELDDHEILKEIAEAGPEGRGTLSHDEMAAQAISLLTGGHRSVAAQLTTCIYLLVSRPDILDRLRTQPDLLSSAVDEMTRYESQARLTVRVAKRNFTFGGQQIREGERIYLLLGSANRDPEAFDEPDELVLDRRPNPHLAFGTGSHFCLGAPMARLELEEALRALLPRLDGLELGGAPEWEATLAKRRLASLRLARR